jgi:hypothetical protein
MRLRAPGLLALAGVMALVLSACSGGGARSSASSSAPARPSGPAFEAGYQSATYSNPAHWLCRADVPGPQNVCLGDLSVTSVAPDGKLTVQHERSAQHAAVDCFYVYPTVDSGPGANENIDAPHTAEMSVTRTQAAPFGSLCNMFAPLYRQSTLRSLFSPTDRAASAALAYGDVQDAFRYYLGHLNQGRPFILLGHSQGSGVLTQLMSQMIDPNPGLRRQMISAIVPGWPIQVPVGGDVGGTFGNIRACRSPTQVNCVIGYSSFRATSPPPDNTLFGRSAGPGLEDLCANPASLAGGSAPLLTMFDINPTDGPLAQPSSLVWAPGTPAPPPITTPYVALPQLMTGQCVNGKFSYLSLTTNPTPGPRAQNIPGDLTPQWGMHLVDVNVAQGNLIDIVRQQIAAWPRAH